MKRISSFILISVFLMTVAGCASEPTLGDRMASHGEGASRLGKDWNKGDKLVQDGIKLRQDGREYITKGNKLIRRGESDVKQGEDMIEKGRRLMKESEEEFRKISS